MNNSAGYAKLQTFDGRLFLWNMDTAAWKELATIDVTAPIDFSNHDE
jgi:hypothetical protein